MFYYTIYVKNVHNGSGYIDVPLADDQLLKDFVIYLDIGVRPHRIYPLANPPGAPPSAAHFVVNMADVVAVTISAPS